MDANSEIWNIILYNLKLQMTQATFDTWLKTSELISQEGDHLAIAVRSQFAVDWLSTRLHDTVLRTAKRIIGRPVQVTFVVADDGNHPQDDDDARDVDSAEGDIRPDCRIAVELINFDPLRAGFVMTSNYAWQYWQPYLAARERETGALNTGVAFCLWNTLRSFPAAWAEKVHSQWPSIYTLADMVARGNRCKILGRNAYGKKRHYKRTVGALEILESEHIVWPQITGTGRDIIYYFRVLDNLPLLVPIQIGKLSPRLQERHAREIERCRLEFEQWQQLSLPTLLKDEG